MRVAVALAAVLLSSWLTWGGPAAAEEAVLEPLPEGVLRKAAGRAFSVEELARHDGRDAGQPLLMAVRGLVFDVSTGGRFYGPGATYHALVGRDASRAVARMSLDAADLTDRCEGLEAAAIDRLVSVMRETYLRKYPIVGHLTGGAFFPRGLCCDTRGCGRCADGR
jgi:predicted heme/steroid binding protein